MINKRKNPFHNNFKGLWIPASLYRIQGLGPLHREVLSFIWSFADKDDCYASNAYMADLFSVSINTIKNAIKFLRENELIKSCGPDKYHRVLKVNSPAIGRLIWEEKNRPKNAPVKHSEGPKSRAKSYPQPGHNLPQTRANFSQSRAKIGPLTNKDNKYRKDKIKGRATRFKASTACRDFTENVFLTRQGKRITVYTRAPKGSSQWHQQQKRLVGVG